MLINGSTDLPPHLQARGGDGGGGQTMMEEDYDLDETTAAQPETLPVEHDRVVSRSEGWSHAPVEGRTHDTQVPKGTAIVMFRPFFVPSSPQSFVMRR